MTSWPSQLPAYPLLDGFRESVPDTAIRTDMEQGPAKVRLRTTAAVSRLSCAYLMSKAQVTALDTFYQAGLQGGALSFEFLHPRRNVTVMARFVRPPEYAAGNGGFFRVSAELEILP